ncbi:hypothetical protein [Methylobacterium adhaesivum]|uniref:Uncharacterized protein n=1 Tax=Methylobacterium adhaesivum TaxID=333297 RepID=A0ABT8BIL0_9HYPH|nr:hypothetical protein [Methylobacterium adhaesivum]MDN3592002.1 hypothetical protein [Methylobacterium adhaesivum]
MGRGRGRSGGGGRHSPHGSVASRAGMGHAAATLARLDIRVAGITRPAGA